MDELNELQKNEIPKECQPCCGSKYIMECLIVYEKRQKDCPCKNCLVQVTCGNNVCSKFEKLMFNIHQKRDSFYQFGGSGTYHEPRVRGI
jgi:hypothetical protein